MLRRFLPAVAGVGFLLYPAVVFLFIDRWSAALLAALLLLVGAARLATARNLALRTRAVGIVALVAFCGTVATASSPAFVKLYPVLISVAGFGFGIWTLTHPPSAIERLVIATDPSERLDGRKRAYMRNVTVVWVGFFLLNGAAAAYTALSASTAAWAVYNGLLSYALMGLLFCGEYAIRIRFRRRHYTEATGIQ